MPDHDPTPHHRHHPLLRVTVTACPDEPEALLLDVDLGQPLDGVTADLLTACLLAWLEGGALVGMDERWAAMMAARN